MASYINVRWEMRRGIQSGSRQMQERTWEQVLGLEITIYSRCRHREHPLSASSAAECGSSNPTRVKKVYLHSEAGTPAYNTASHTMFRGPALPTCSFHPNPC